ncbi:hypothetical protein BH11GEM2_BH11GEM2_39500 [soil metagenome]
MVLVLLVGCSVGGGTSVWAVAVGAGGLPPWRGCQLVESDPSDAVTHNSGDFYDATKPGTASFTCDGKKVRLDIVRATALSIEGPDTVAPGKELMLALHATADRTDLTLGDHPPVTWSYSGTLEGTGQCKELSGCTEGGYQRVRASAPGNGVATATFGGLTARYEVTVR